MSTLFAPIYIYTDGSDSHDKKDVGVVPSAWALCVVAVNTTTAKEYVLGYLTDTVFILNQHSCKN